MIHELRIYKLHKGMQKAFIKEFRKARRFMEKYGIVFVAAWETDRPDEFAWIRAFPSVKARAEAIDAYYGSPEWLKIVGTIRPLILRRTVRVMKGLKVSGTQL
ncbi:MAG: NIPSNAP family protein [Candidatus Latescibacterota bacterium]|nr:NIPSNAP family protein [Candidatus Latescibacterota bacterium]